MGLNVAQMSEIGIVLDKRSGDVIFNEGDPGHEMYVVVSGKVEISLKNESKSVILC
jgi:CRP-like cAMP-binding protein